MQAPRVGHLHAFLQLFATAFIFAARNFTLVWSCSTVVVVVVVVSAQYYFRLIRVFFQFKF